MVCSKKNQQGNWGHMNMIESDKELRKKRELRRFQNKAQNHL